jgi:hypothetical protein
VPNPCRCGAPPHPTDAERCERGHVLAANNAARTHGVWSLERGRGREALPPTMQASVDDFREGLARDKGGIDNMTTLEVAYIRRIAELEAVVRLLAADLASKGLSTPKGRIRSTYSRWLEGLDRWDRYAQRLGVERKARPVLSATAILNGHTEDER